MQVDWLTVAAQIVNFLILIALLKRLLYRPIVSTMEARQRYIENQLEQARQLKFRGEQLITTYRSKLEAFEGERQQLLERAKREAESERQALLEKARLEVEQKRLEWQQDLAREQAGLLQELKTLLAEQLVELGRRAFKDLAGRSLEDCILDRWLEKVAEIPQDRRALLATATECTLVTTFPLDPGARARIERTLKRINPEMAICFELRPELICGIVLEAGDRLWHWDLASYLDELELALRKQLPEGVS